MYANGEFVEQDHYKVVELFDKVCQYSESNSCNHLGVRHQKGEGIKQDYEEALREFEKSFRLENPYGCNICSTRI